MQLRIGKSTDLARYLAKQADNLFPSSDLALDVDALAQVVPTALERMRPIVAAVRNFTPNYFDHLNSLQHTSFLYLAANEIFKLSGPCELAERLYCTNRALHSIDLYYKVTMPEVFFLSHGLGAVLGNTRYGNYIVIFHNVTVGRVGDARPTIGNNVVLYPGVTVTGSSVVGDNCVISAGVVLNNLDIPDNSTVRMLGGQIVLAQRKRDISELYFRASYEKSELNKANQ